MILYRVIEKHIVGTVRNTVFRRHTCEWVLPQEVALKISYNPNHLPVVIGRSNDEDYYLRLSIRRIVNGYCVHRTAVPINLWYQGK